MKYKLIDFSESETQLCLLCRLARTIHAQTSWFHNWTQPHGTSYPLNLVK